MILILIVGEFGLLGRDGFFLRGEKGDLGLFGRFGF